MGRVMLCVGNYAKTPYYMERLQRNVYCIEELCYSFQENAFLLDESIVNKSLAQWLEKECGLPDLAGQLYSQVRAKCSVSTFVAVILEYAAYCTQEDIQNTKVLLQSNANKGDLEKRKSHADFMVQQKRYSIAIKEYAGILDALTPENGHLLGPVFHNMGTAYAGLFLFDAAAERFLQAFEADGERESGLCYLAAKRFALPEQEYIGFVADKAGAYGPSLEVEQKLEQVMGQWEDSEQGIVWKQLMEEKEEGRAQYYERALRLAEQMKEAYKRMA